MVNGDTSCTGGVTEQRHEHKHHPIPVWHRVRHVYDVVSGTGVLAENRTVNKVMNTSSLSRYICLYLNNAYGICTLLQP